MTKIYDITITGKRISQVYDVKQIEDKILEAIKSLNTKSLENFDKDIVHFDIKVKVTESVEKFGERF